MSAATPSLILQQALSSLAAGQLAQAERLLQPLLRDPAAGLLAPLSAALLGRLHPGQRFLELQQQAGRLQDVTFQLNNPWGKALAEQ